MPEGILTKCSVFVLQECIIRMRVDLITQHNDFKVCRSSNNEGLLSLCGYRLLVRPRRHSFVLPKKISHCVAMLTDRRAAGRRLNHTGDQQRTLSDNADNSLVTNLLQLMGTSYLSTEWASGLRKDHHFVILYVFFDQPLKVRHLANGRFRRFWPLALQLGNCEAYGDGNDREYDGKDRRSKLTGEETY